MPPSQNKTSLIIFGKDTGLEVLNTARLVHEDSFTFIELIPFDEDISTNKFLIEQKANNSSLFYIVAIADQKLRAAAQKFAESESMAAFSVIHPTAVIDQTANIGVGTFIGPLAVISSRAEIGAHSIIHIHSSIGHHAKLGQNCIILPGARISGRCRLGSNVLVGSNAFIFQGAILGDYSTVDALTYVKDDLLAHRIASSRSTQRLRQIK